MGGFVAPGRELMLEFGEGVVGEGGGHAGSHAGRRGDAKRAGGGDGGRRGCAVGKVPGSL
jgi:hypothetical protein